jgi:8-oxo-dGTP pyrophosphatase MutT (NUDIX family)
MSGFEFNAALSNIITRYQSNIADITDDLALLQARLAAGDDLSSRRTFPGHVTTSAIIVNEAMTSTLLILHKASGRWLQPGGHWEPSPSFNASALREAQEETGLNAPTLHPWHNSSDNPIDIDTHAIGARPSRNEPDHFHFDLRYVFVASMSETLVAQAEEINAIGWQPFNTLEAICPRVWRRLISACRV